MKTLEREKNYRGNRTWAVQVNTDLPKDVEQALEQGRAQEESPFGIYCFNQILANAKLAREEHRPCVRIPAPWSFTATLVRICTSLAAMSRRPSTKECGLAMTKAICAGVSSKSQCLSAPIPVTIRRQ